MILNQTLEIYKATTWKRFSLYDFWSSVHMDASGVTAPATYYYEGRITEWVEINERVPDDYYGIQSPQNVNFRLNNHDDYFSTWYTLSASVDFRNAPVMIRLWDGTVEKQSYTGRVNAYELGENLDLSITLNDPEIFNKLYPSKLIDSAIDAEAASVSVGLPVPVPLGYSHAHRMRVIREDTTNQLFDYLVGFSKCDTGDIFIRRDGVLVEATEYAMQSGTQVTPYPGYAYVRFTYEQKDFSLNYYDLTIESKGIMHSGTATVATADNNYVKTLQALLSNSTWGLGLTVVATNWATQSSRLSNSSAVIALPMTEQKPAHEWINAILWPARSYIYCSSCESSGNVAYRIETDYNRDPTTYTAGWLDGRYENIIEISPLTARPILERPKKMIVKWMPCDYKNDGFLVASTVTLYAKGGEDRTIEAPAMGGQIGLHGDPVIDYWANRYAYRDRKLSLTANHELLWVSLMDVITVKATKYGIDDQFQVVGLTRKYGEIDLDLELYSTLKWSNTWAIQSTINGTPEPEDEAKIIRPNPPTSFSIVFNRHQGTVWEARAYADRPAGSSAYAESNFRELVFGWTFATATAYTWQIGSQITSNMVTTYNSRYRSYYTKFYPVPSCVSVQYAAKVRNLYGLESCLTTLTTRCS